MPQLDTIYIFTTFLWTWLTLHLIMKKTHTFKIISTPGKTHMTKMAQTMTLPWT